MSTAQDDNSSYEESLGSDDKLGSDDEWSDSSSESPDDDFIEPPLASILASESKSQLLKSVAITEYFRKLSILVVQVIPGLLGRLVSTPSFTNEERVKELHSLMSDAFCIKDAQSLLIFFKKYSQKMASAIEMPCLNSTKKLVEYIDKDLEKDLPKATSLDLNDLVLPLKKSILTKLSELSQKYHNEFVKEDEFGEFMSKQLRRYEWIRKLTSVQQDITKFSEIYKSRPLDESEKAGLARLIETDHLEDENVEPCLKYLELYGRIQHKIKGSPDHPIIITITANSLSLQDIIGKWLSTGNFEEVRILCMEYFYVDDSMLCSLYKGKNVAIVASKVVVDTQRKIDVSGIDRPRLLRSPAPDGPKPGTDGQNGKPGKPGESGGNILICTDEFENSELLFLRSVGGCGGNGQDGGSGQNGVGTPSKSDNLDRFGGHDKIRILDFHRKGLYVDKFKKYYTNVETSGENHAYGILDGVEVLFGRYLESYGFMYSKGVQGVSADGGNAGRGGRAGGGGKAGHIDIYMKNGIDQNLDHNVDAYSEGGIDGTAGNPGKAGQKDLQESKKDYLVVDALMKPAIRHPPGFISAQAWRVCDDRNALPRGWYCCRYEVAKHLSSGLEQHKKSVWSYIEFFRRNRPDYCTTISNQQAKDGEEHEKEDEVVHSTPSKPIDKVEILIEFQVFASKRLQIQDNSSLIDLLQDMQQKLREQLETLETTYVKQQHKRRQKFGGSSNSEFLPFFHLDAGSISRLTTTAVKPELSPKVIAKLKANPLVSESDGIIANSLQTTLLKLVDLAQEKLSVPDRDTCESVWQVMEVLFHRNVFSRIPRNEPLQNILALLKQAEGLSTSLQTDFHDRLTSMKQNVLPRYEILKLSQAHQNLLRIITYSDMDFQRKAVAVYRRISLQKSIEGIDEVLASFFEDGDNLKDTLNVPPFTSPLREAKVSCNAVLPFSSQVKSALEMLMIFINEANRISCGKFHYPNILQAVEREYAAFRSTISNYDLMFIMTYIQDKLHHILSDRAQLEDVFCEQLLSKKEELNLYKEGFISYHNESYRISDVIYVPREHAVRVTSQSLRDDSTKLFRIDLDRSKVTLDQKPVDFPETLLVSTLNVQSLWNEIKEGLIENKTLLRDDMFEAFLEKVSLPLEEVDCKYRLTVFLRQARSAQDIQFDVFSFHPPSHWVERLILSEVQKIYNDHDNNYVAKIENIICGLSGCYDKSLYHMLFTQFLQNISQQQLKSESFKEDLAQVLERMRLIFITQSLCSVVTKQGISQAGREDADYIYDSLMEFQIIDSVGIFSPNITEQSIESYCIFQKMDTLYLKTVFILQRYISQLPGKELSFWNHKLGELRLRLLLQQLTCGDNSLCDYLTVAIYQMQRQYGEKPVHDFVEEIYKHSKSQIPSDRLKHLFSKCSRKEWIFSIVYSHFTKQTVQCVNDSNSSSLVLKVLDDLDSFDWESELNKQRTTKEITKVLKSQHPPMKGTNHLHSVFDKVEEQVSLIKQRESCKSVFTFDVKDEQLKEELNRLPLKKFSKCHITHWVTKFKEKVFEKEDLQNPYIIEAFAVIRRGITIYYETEKKTEDVIPRDVQMVASLLFFQNLSAQGMAQGTKLLQQISTGEGKTMILCMVAIYKALQGEKVDIVTSSSVLATRDAENQKPLYGLFDISVSHCCHEEPTRRRKAYRADVIYGDIGSYQRDILETDFYDRNIRTDRNFENVFVDEIDSMLVDKGQNMLYLPHALPDMNCLDEVYLEIWSLVNAKDFLGLEPEQEQLHYAMWHRLFGAVAPNAFTAIPEVSEKRSEEIFQSLVNRGIIDSKNHCLNITNFSDIMNCVNKIVQEKELRLEVLLIIQQHIEAKPLIQEIPKSLHPFIRKSLRAWIQSAVCAKFFRPNKEYIIDIDRRESACDRYPKIVIMDNETGVEQESSEWGSGLHQFLQLKHNLRLTAETLKAVYMSNISFFTRRYTNIMGVTGTLGSMEEHDLFKKFYKDTLIVEMPTNKPKRLIVELPECQPTKSEWEEAVYSDVKEKLGDSRVVLLICEDVQGARNMQQFLKSKDKELQSVLYLSSHQEKLEEMENFGPKKLIIATNIAGRGTDIKLTDAVKQNGGLHVCLSYLPPNVRVQLQAYGRAARSGDPGSCKMIFHSKEGDLSYAIRKRNLAEAHRVADIEVDYIQNIRVQERLFDKFSTLFYEIRDKDKKRDKKKEEKEKKKEKKGKEKNKELQLRALLDHCLDCWAFFLDRYTDAIEALPKKSSSQARSETDRIWQAFNSEVKAPMDRVKDVKDDDIKHLPLSPRRLLQMGHTFMRQELLREGKFKEANNKKDFAKAVSLYQQVAAECTNDPFALYYSAAARLSDSFCDKNTTIDTGKEERRKLKQAFYTIIPLFQHRITKCQDQVTKLHMANRHQDQTITGNKQYFSEQKHHEIELYSQFISTMQDVIGHSISQDMFDHADWGKDGAMVVFQIVKENFSDQPLPRIARTYSSRLDECLSSSSLYYTYQEKIKQRVISLIGQSVDQDAFDGVLPDKEDFWNQLIEKQLITTVKRGQTKETLTKALKSRDEHKESSIMQNADPKTDYSTTKKDERIASWDPTVDIDKVQLRSWDCIDVQSFDWIPGIKRTEREYIHTQLKVNSYLSSEGVVKNLDLSKPLTISLPQSYAKYYKAIKDTLWHHAIYRFVLQHLRDCAEIDVENDISDSKPSKQTSIVDMVCSLNPSANVSFGEKVKHVVVSTFKSLKTWTLRSTAGSKESEDDVLDIPTLTDHLPTNELNNKFIDQLTDIELTVTQVSGSGLNCMINAMLQHAKQEYLTQNFKEADVVRESVQRKHPHIDLSGTLHSDDEIAGEILANVNDECSSEIANVSVFIASSDGPILYGGTCDKRFPEGKHVALWQQGNHYVAIVHKKEFAESSYQAESDIDNDFDEKIPQITTDQLEKLKKMKIVSKAGKKYCICMPIEKIESLLENAFRSESVSIWDKHKMQNFLRFKLEIDFKTLCNSHRLLVTEQSKVLYDDLCLYSVIKELKMKKTEKEIDKKCKELKIEDAYWYKDAANIVIEEIPYHLKLTVLNKYLGHKKVRRVNPHDFQTLKRNLRAENPKIVRLTRNKCLKTAANSFSTSFLHESQRSEVRKFVLLMLQLRKNSSTIQTTLKNQQSTLLELETPEVSLRKLADVFEDSLQDKGDVLGWFSDNQCYFIINVAEQKWSWKTITTALCVIAIGVTQIVVGAVLLAVTSGAGSFFCNALISEGVSDMIFGIEGLVRGHCNWSQYFNHKIMSLAITVATAGVGAYLGKGVQASSYTFKAFGNASKEIAKKTAEETGKSFTKIMAKQVAKKIAKKVGEAVVEAGANLFIDQVASWVSQSIESISGSIVELFDAMTEDQQLRREVITFLQKESPDRAEKYLHQKFTRVMQQRTFLEILDDIQSKVQKGASIATRAYGSATKHIKMADPSNNLKGSGLMKGVKHASRFLPVVAEAAKIGLTKTKMDIMKQDLIQELVGHHVVTHNQEPLDLEICEDILEKEFKNMREYLTQQVAQRGKTIVSSGLHILHQEMKKRVTTWGKEDVIAKIRGGIDMRQLQKYERELSAAQSKDNDSMVVKYEAKLNRLMARSRNPAIFARLIEKHDVQLGPAFAIPTLEKMTGRRIIIVSKDKTPLINVSQHNTTKSNAPLEITFIPGKGQQGHFYVGKEPFSIEHHGNDCLIHAVMKGAGISNYTASDVRNKIAEACKSKEEPCYEYIVKGIASHYVELDLVGGGKPRPRWWKPIYPFLREYGTKVHGLDNLDEIKQLNMKSGTKGFRARKLDICHIISWKNITAMIDSDLNEGSPENLKKLQVMLPTIEEVNSGKSIFGDGDGSEAFLKAFSNNNEYTRGVERVQSIINSFNPSKPMEHSDRLELEKIFHSAPGNLGLGDSTTNRRIQGHMDYHPEEPRAKALKEKFDGNPHLTPHKLDAEGNPMTSFCIKTRALSDKPKKKVSAVKKSEDSGKGSAEKTPLSKFKKTLILKRK